MRSVDYPVRGQRTRSFAYALILLSLISVATFAQTSRGQIRTVPVPVSAWHQFKAADNSFTIEFPQAPERGSRNISYAGIEFPMYTFSHSRPARHFEASYIDYPAGFNNQEGAFEGSIAAMARAIESNGGRVLSREKIQHKGCEGRELMGTTPASPLMRARVFQSGQRIYILVNFAMRDTPYESAEGDRFFASFTVADGCTAAMTPVEAPSSTITTSFIEGTLDQATGWRLINSARDRFSVLMPTRAKADEQAAQVQPFPLSYRAYRAVDKRIVYNVSVLGDYPAGVYKMANSYQVALDLQQVFLSK